MKQIFSIVFVVTMVYIFIASSCSTKVTDPTRSDSFSACHMAEKYVEDYLISGSGDFSNTRASTSDNGISWTANGSVTSTNKFNAKIKKSWSVKMTYLGNGGWKLNDINID